jgi:hypothetical protein
MVELYGGASGGLAVCLGILVLGTQDLSTLRVLVAFKDSDTVSSSVAR